MKSPRLENEYGSLRSLADADACCVRCRRRSLTSVRYAPSRSRPRVTSRVTCTYTTARGLSSATSATVASANRRTFAITCCFIRVSQSASHITSSSLFPTKWGSAARFLDLQNFLSWASSGVIRSSCMSLRTHITSF